jgi:hypothetical protein
MSHEAKSEKQAQESADDDLRVAFALLRDSDARRAKPFVSACFEATHDVCPSRQGVTQHAPDKAIRQRPKYLIAAVAAILIAAVVIRHRALEDRSAVPKQAAQDAPHLALASISEWRAPSDVLLATSDRELWRSVPQLSDAPKIHWNDSSH